MVLKLLLPACGEKVGMSGLQCKFEPSLMTGSSSDRIGVARPPFDPSLRLRALDMRQPCPLGQGYRIGVYR